MTFLANPHRAHRSAAKSSQCPDCDRHRTGCSGVSGGQLCYVPRAVSVAGKRGEMIMNALCTGTLALVAFGVSVSMSLAADLGGTWLTEGGTATVRLANCGDAVCGTIIALKQPNDPETGKPQTDRNNTNASLRNRPILGLQIVFGMKPSGTNKW